MFNSIGILEIAMIAGIALMVLGPEKFPGFAKLSVRTFRDLKKYIAETQREIASELNPMKEELNSLKKVDIEGYVDKLIGDDDVAKSNDDEPEDEIEGEYNGEPDSSVIDDWYPEDMNEIMPGDDETAETDDTADVDESEEEPEEEPVSDEVGETVPYDASAQAEDVVESSTEEVDEPLPEREDDFDMASGFDGREEVVDAENPERLDT